MSTINPTSVDELAAALKDTAPASVAVAGGGSKSRWGGLGSPPDVTVETTSLDRVVEHAVDDLVVTVEAGIRLADLQESLAQHRQRLSVDPPEIGATVGGIVATAASGPRRLRFGTPRDLLIGITVVLADGAVARSGGKVVKNVAGYDLGKLFAGSFGTLGVIATCTFRLQPLPAARRLVSVTTDAPGEKVRALLRSPSQPTAVEWSDDTLQVLIETTDAAADSEAKKVVALIGGDIDQQLSAGFGQRPWQPGEIAVKVTHRLSAVDAALDAVRQALPGARVSAHAGAGVILAGWSGDASQIVSLRETISSYDGSVVVVDAPDDVKRSIDVWGPVRGLAVMRRIKEQFDPDARMNRGRFVDGI